MKKSENLVVHLETGYVFLLSIETSEKENIETALNQAVITALKNDLNFSYHKDGSKELKEAIEFLKRDDETDEETLDNNNYMYLDLSSDYDFNVYIAMGCTRIDHTLYENTYLLNELK